MSGLWPVVHQRATIDQPTFLGVDGVELQDRMLSVPVERDPLNRSIEVLEPFKQGQFKLECSELGPMLENGQCKSNDLLLLSVEDDAQYGGRRSGSVEQKHVPEGSEFWTRSARDNAISLLAYYARDGFRRLKDNEPGSFFQKLFFQMYDFGYYIFQMKPNTAIALNRREGYLMYLWDGINLKVNFRTLRDYEMFKMFHGMEKFESVCLKTA